MNILITGGNTTNKGAYLMLLAVQQQGEQYFSNATFVLAPTMTNKTELKEIGFEFLDYPLFHVGTKRIFEYGLKYPFLIRIASKYLRKKNLAGSIKLKNIDIVLDVSGFAFGDKFGLVPLNNLEKQIRFFKKINIPFVLMPQAFGPFTGDLEKHASKAFLKADLIFARDKVSYNNILTVSSNSNIHQSKDITLSLMSNEKLPDEIKKNAPYCCIVPNVRMLDKADKSWRENYIGALVMGVQLILEKSDLHVLILIHSSTSSSDIEVASNVLKALKNTARVTIESNENPLVLKSIIKKSKFLVGSRFHALASALSSSTPAIATSWLHKYEMLFDEYGLSEYSHNQYTDAFLKNINNLLIDKECKRIENLLVQKNILFEKDNIEMWAKIKNIVNQK